MAPTEAPKTRSGRMPRRVSSSSMPICTAPRLPPPASTKAVRCGWAGAGLCGRRARCGALDPGRRSSSAACARPSAAEAARAPKKPSRSGGGRSCRVGVPVAGRVTAVDAVASTASVGPASSDARRAAASAGCRHFPPSRRGRAGVPSGAGCRLPGRVLLSLAPDLPARHVVTHRPHDDENGERQDGHDEDAEDDEKGGVRRRRSG